MNFSKAGAYWSQVAFADIEQTFSMMDKASQAVVASSNIEQLRSSILRMRARLRHLQEDFKHILHENNIPPIDVSVIGEIQDDDTAPVSTNADTSDKTPYSEVRVHNIPQPAVNELNEVADNNMDPLMSKILGLVSGIKFTNLAIARAEAKIRNIQAARKTFEEKVKADKPMFNNWRDMLLAVSEMAGYVEVLTEISDNKPAITTSDDKIRASTDQFDKLCWRWKQNIVKLRRSIKDFIDTYQKEFISATEFDKMDPKTILSIMEDREKKFGISKEEQINKLKVKFGVFIVNDKEYKFELNTTFERLFENMKRFVDEEFEKMEHFTQVGVGTVSTLGLLASCLGTIRDCLDVQINKWAGGAGKLSYNPAVQKVMDKAKQLVESPVKRSVVSTENLYDRFHKSKINFVKLNEKIDKINGWLGGNLDKLYNKMGEWMGDFDKAIIENVCARKCAPVKDNTKEMKFDEDAARKTIRARYGNIPFEDEVDLGEGAKKRFEKESLCVYDPKTKKWSSRTDVVNDALEEKATEPQNINSGTGQ